ncbi:MAG: HAD family phosphatase [Lachnospiraceae bacterium]|nr:HAD family phosphatase [Lachnospiraceae bacterium]MBR5765244.1 HAD family phosphatase [Lachnospiraceae bacterium]MBR6468899.1 HAD family phosphatase [Lachnospiraceae bacterium]MBR6485365.1 HAD family phosphatase [Lachnospiraceae bacterium]
MSRFDTVILDIGNVLVDFCWKEHIDSFGFDKDIKERIAKASVLSDDWNEFDRGAISEDEIIERFVANDPGIEAEIRRTYADITTLLKQYEGAKPFINKLKSMGLKVLYLSNFSEKAERECAKELDFLPLTDGGILSWNVKLIKPDPKIYKMLIDMYDLEPSRCIFFDDTPRNVEGARKCGFSAEVFVSYDEALKLITQ